MYRVQSRVNGYLIDEERCATFVEAQDALDRRRRALVSAGATIVAEDARQYVLAHTSHGGVVLMVTVGGPH